MPITGDTLAPTRARLNVARLGAFRLNYPTYLTISVNGTERQYHFDRESVRITDAIEEEPNIAQLEVFGFTPAVNQTLIIGRAGLTSKEFSGTITEVKQLRYKLNQGRVVWSVKAVDWTPLLGTRLYSGAWSSASATSVALDIVSYAPSGVTSTKVQPGLPDVTIQFKMTPLNDALTQLCRAIGAFWYVDYDKVVHLFTAEEETALTIDANNKRFYQLEHGSNMDTLWNRVWVEGQGTRVLAQIAAGQSVIPIEEAAIFASSGTNYAFTANQRLTYTGQVTGNTGTTVYGKTDSEYTGGATTVSVPSEVAGNIIEGSRTYRTTFVVNGGESTVSSTSSAAVVPGITGPGAISSVTGTTGGSMTASTTYIYGLTFTTAVGETAMQSVAGQVTLNASQNAVSMTGIPTSSDDRVTGRKLYRWSSGLSGAYRLVATFNDNTTTSHTDTVAVASEGATAGPGTPAGTGQVELTNIPVGPSGTTARRVYRTTDGGSVYKLVVQINDNTTTSYTDNVADEALGEAAPNVSTIGSTAGDITLRVADHSVLPSAGWGLLAGQVIKWTGKNTGSGHITGIPSSGVGSMAVGVAVGTPILVAPQLTGIPANGSGAITETIPAGAEINLVEMREDSASQATYGIRETFIQDRRLNRTSCQTRGDAQLEIAASPRQFGRFKTTDTSVRSGTVLNISMSAEWGLSGTFTVMQVDITMEPGRPQPMRSVTFASTRQARELFAIIRQLEHKQQG